MLVALAGGFGWILQRISPLPATSNAAAPLSPQQITTVVDTVPEPLIRLIVKSRTAETSARAQVAELAQRLSISNAAVQTFFEIIGESHVQEQDVRSKLVEVAAGYIALRESVGHMSYLSDETARFFSEAVAYVANGKLRQADTALMQAENVAYGVVQGLRPSGGEAYRAATMALANIRATRGDLALTTLNYEAAIGRYNDAIDAVNGKEIIKAHMQLQIGEVYFRLWSRTKDIDDLQRSVDNYSAGFRLFNACLCDINNFARHAYQFGTGLMQVPVRIGDQSRLIEAGGLIQSALDQREARLPAADIVRAKMSVAEAYALDLESDREPGFTIDNLNCASTAVQAAGEADLDAGLVPEEERYRAKLIFARAYAQLAKQASLGQGTDRAHQLLPLAEEAIEKASRLQRLTPSDAARTRTRPV